MGTPSPASPGSLWTFNVKDGYCEAVLRGYRQCLLTPDEYRRLGLADTISDLRSALEETDYGTFLQDEPLPLSVATIAAKCREKLASEFRYLRSCAAQPLVQFLDFIVAERMIDNVVNVIQGALNKKRGDELFSRLDPLGWFPEMKGIAAAVGGGPGADGAAGAAAADGYDEVYRSLLLESPVGPYVEEYLTERGAAGGGAPGGGAAGGGAAAGGEHVSGLLTEQDLELMRSALKRAWLEKFHAFCESLGGITAEVMGHILRTEADFRVLSVTLNSLRSALGQTARLQERNSLYPSFGYLYPEGTDKIRKAWNDLTVRTALEGFPAYSALYEECKQFYTQPEPAAAAAAAADADAGGAGVGGAAAAGGDAPAAPAAAPAHTAKSLEDVLFKESVRMCEMAFEQQFHYGVFYAWVKLKEQEIRNIVWIADMILMKRKEHLDQILPIFPPRV